MKDGTAFYFYWRHYGFYVDEHGTLEDAVSAATHDSDYGEAAYDHFEVWENGALRVLSHKETGDLIDAESEARYESDKRLRDKAAKPIGVVRLRATQMSGAIGNGEKTARLHTAYTEDQRDQYLADARAVFGGDRVAWEPVS